MRQRKCGGIFIQMGNSRFRETGRAPDRRGDRLKIPGFTIDYCAGQINVSMVYYALCKRKNQNNEP